VTHELQSALADLYEVFSTPRPRAVEGCDHCDHDFSEILSTDLRSISEDALFKYAGAVFYTCGSDSDFRYFLPRMIELCFTGFGFQYPQVVLGKLPLAKWATWPLHERKSIIAVVEAALADQCMQAEPSGLSIDDTLCAAHCAEMDIAPLFDILIAWPDATAALYFDNLDEAGSLKARNPFARPGYADRLAEFYSSPRASAAVTAAWTKLGS